MAKSMLFNFLNLQFKLKKIDEVFLQKQVDKGRIAEDEYKKIVGLSKSN